MDARGGRRSERNLDFDSQRPTANGQWPVRITRAFTTRFNHDRPKFPIGDFRGYRHSTILFHDSKCKRSVKADYNVIGVRPSSASSGAASTGCSDASDSIGARSRSDIAAPEDGRTPPRRSPAGADPLLKVEWSLHPALSWQ